MGFSNMLEILQEKNKGKIVLIKLGTFYIATGRDALLLSVKLGLKCTCYKNNICKVGVPVSSIDKYIEKLNKIRYSYIIYDYDKEQKELKVKCEKKGRFNKIVLENNNCLLCKGIQKYSDDEYMQAVLKLFENDALKGKSDELDGK